MHRSTPQTRANLLQPDGGVIQATQVGDDNKEESDNVVNDVAMPIAPAAPGLVVQPIRIYRRGHPLPYDLRARVMLYLQQGLAKQTIAQRLSISRSTVLRYEKAAVAQSVPIPGVQNRGGFRSAIAMLNRQQILKLGEMLLQHPKLTIRELKQLAVDAAVLDPEKVPSDTTVWRAIHKLNLDFSKVVYVDPKGSKQYLSRLQRETQDAENQEEEKKNDHGGAQLPAQAASAPAHKTEEGDLISDERRAFRFVQKQGLDGQLNPTNLIFMDETNS
jgi:transposase